MKTSTFLVALLPLLLFAHAATSEPAELRFDGRIGNERFVGVLEGECGMFKMNYSKPNAAIEIVGEGGLRREVFVKSIDRIEVKASGEKPTVTITAGTRVIEGKFYCGSVYLVTDAEKVDLNAIGRRTVTLERVK